MYKTLELTHKIKFIVSDFDGIFTDNSVFVVDSETKIKKLSFKDLMGIAECKRNGIDVGIISGEKCAQIDYVAEKFDLKEIHQGIRNKLPVLNQIKEKYSLSEEEILYVGDDINDIECLKSVNHSITVPQANYKVKMLDNVQITQANAGDGAFREIVDNLVELKNTAALHKDEK